MFLKEEKMKLLFVFTGGTIGSTQSDNVINIDGEKPYKIIGAYENKYGVDFEYDVAEPYSELSENNTGWHIKALATCVKENIDKDYDGIIVTHGSDTLQYTSAALGYCFGLYSLPVCMVASNAPIEDETSNALENMHGAVTFIKNKYGRGVFTVYKNAKDKCVNVHRATRLIGPKAYSDELSSAFDCVYGRFDESFEYEKNSEYFEREDEIKPLDASLLPDVSKEILVLGAYAGMAYPEIPQGVKYILLNTYHSGTLNVRSKETEEFLLKSKKMGIRVFATGVSCGAQYASAEQYNALGIEPIVSLSPIAAYVKLWLSGADNLNDSLCGDIIV